MIVKSQGSGITYKLVDKAGKELNVGDEVTTFRGAKAKITGGTPPQHMGSTGHVEIDETDRGYRQWLYAGVVDAKWQIVATDGSVK